MPKSVLHGCYDIHIKKEKRAPVYRLVRDRDFRMIQDADLTLCGVSADNSMWWRRKPVKISEARCVKTVTCKRCVVSINKHKRINNKPK